MFIIEFKTILVDLIQAVSTWANDPYISTIH